jgi:tetratricopeptide (TPR) repeat protein
MHENLTAFRWHFLATAVIAGITALGDTHLAGAADQALIATARGTLYRNRDGSLAILEDAVRRNPEEIAYWVEYIHALGIDPDKSFADRASRHALELHPHHPDLLLARARLHGGGVALEALAELAKVPGYQTEAGRLKDLAVCGLFLPESEPWPAETFATLADRLLVIGRADDAARYIDEGLKTIVGEGAKPLLARRAMLAALKGEFKRAMKLHNLAGCAQVVMQDSYYGLVDVLLAKNKLDSAMMSFGGHPPADENFRRMLAIAKSRSNDADGALELLGGDALEDRLLRCRVLLSAGRMDDAKAFGRELVEPLKIQSGSYAGPWIGYANAGPRSLLEDYRSVIRWLNKQFPEKRVGIEFELGCGTEELPITPAGWSPAEPISQEIARLEVAARKPMATADREMARIELSEAYEKVGRYRDAANLWTTDAPTDDRGVINFAWVRWSMLRRQEETLAASEKDHASLAAARPLIANGRASRRHWPTINGQRCLPDTEVVKRLVAIGPAVLADVMTQLGPNAISGEDRRPWVAVIEQLGSPRDAPVLISTLDKVTRGPIAARISLRPEQEENDRLTAAAVDNCLKKLTGANPEGKERAIAWSKWWAGNVTRIAAGKQPK